MKPDVYAHTYTHTHTHTNTCWKFFWCNSCIQFLTCNWWEKKRTESRNLDKNTKFGIFRIFDLQKENFNKKSIYRFIPISIISKYGSCWPVMSKEGNLQNCKRLQRKIMLSFDVDEKLHLNRWQRKKNNFEKELVCNSKLYFFAPYFALRKIFLSKLGKIC